MTVILSLAIFTIAAISATLMALFLNHRWGGDVTPADLVKAHDEQLKSIEERRLSGGLEEEQANKARVKILQKLAAKAAASGPKQGPILSPRSGAVISGILAAGIASLLAVSGQFDQAKHTQIVPASSNQRENSIAAAASFDKADSTISNLKAYASGAGKPGWPTKPVKNKKRPLPGVDTMIKRIAVRLESAPDNANDWRMLGWSYFRTNRYNEAVDAYARAVALLSDNASWQSEYGAALVKNSGGKITDEARAVFAKALELDPSDRVSRFYTALVKKNDDDKNGALEDWIALLRDYPDVQSWSGPLKEQILALAKEIGKDVSDLLPGAKLAKAPVMMAIKGPSAGDIRAAQKLSSEERSEMIRGMVQRLATRLETSPDDAKGWVQLIRSRMALREPGKAQAALDQAMGIFKERPKIKKQIVQEAKSLGVTPTPSALP